MFIGFPNTLWVYKILNSETEWFKAFNSLLEGKKKPVCNLFVAFSLVKSISIPETGAPKQLIDILYVNYGFTFTATCHFYTVQTDT